MRTRLFQVLKIVLFIGLAGGFFFFVPIQKIVDAIRGASAVYFWVSILLSFPVLYLSAVRLWMLTHRQGIAITPFQLFEINLVVKFYSFFSPASTLGSLLRWYKLSGNGKSAEALTAVAVNRLFDIFIAVIFGLFWVLGKSNQKILIQPAWIFLFLAVVVLLWFSLTHFSPPIVLRIQTWTEQSDRNWLRKIGGYMGRLTSSLRVYSQFSARDLLWMVVIGLTSELLGVLGYYSLALSIGAPVQFADWGWMRAIFFLTSLVPFTLTGGIGLREISIVWVLTAMDVHADLAAAFSFLVYVRSVFTSLVGGLIELISLRLPHK